MYRVNGFGIPVHQKWISNRLRRSLPSSLSLLSSTTKTSRLYSSSSSSPSSTNQQKSVVVKDEEDEETISPSSSSHITIIEPTTQCEVVLLGCFHGTQSSADDVRRLSCLSSSSLPSSPSFPNQDDKNRENSDQPFQQQQQQQQNQQKGTDVVVLELCTSRFIDLRKEYEKQKQLEQEQDESTKSSSSLRSSWPVRYVQMVSTTMERQGIATGFAAALLSGVSGFQSAMSGFQPGLEFRTALQEIDDASGNSGDGSSSTSCEIILADQAVDETLRKLGRVPIDIWQSLSTSIVITVGCRNSYDDIQQQLTLGGGTSDNSINDKKKSSFLSLLEESLFHLTTLRIALFGDTNGYDDSDGGSSSNNNNNNDDISSNSSIPQVQIFPVLLRNQAAIRDLIRLAIPSIVVITILSNALASILGTSSPMLLEEDVITMTSTMINNNDIIDTGSIHDGSVSSWLMHSVASSLILSSGLFVMTPIIRIILTERDAILTEGILAACQRAGKGGRVVAVLGLLHVNGVARRIMDPNRRSRKNQDVWNEDEYDR